MSVHVRLQRHGTRHRPFYHVVAVDSRKKRDGKVIEKLGTYDPSHEPSLFEVKSDRLQFWYERGAQMTNTVAKLVKVKKLAISRATGSASTEPKAAKPAAKAKAMTK